MCMCKDFAALKWCSIRPEDGEALIEFAVFLTGCYNTVESIKYNTEMDSPTNMRTIISKLSFKLRERWRGVTCEIQEKKHRGPVFRDLVGYVDKQAKIASHPLFGNIQEPIFPKDNSKMRMSKVSTFRAEGKKNIFATDVIPVLEHKGQARWYKDSSSYASTRKQCLFCKKGHNWTPCGESPVRDIILL